MMPGNFDNKMKITKDGCLAPSGPLETASNERVLRLDVWIWQARGACMASLRDLQPGQKRWMMAEDHHNNHAGAGFEPGPAAAMGIMVTAKGEETKTFQWTEGILLE